MADWRETFPSWLAARMGERGLVTARQLGNHVGLAAYLAELWISGGGRPSRDTCARVGRAFGVPLTEVLAAAGYEA
jgi:hypothetical protein